jgi:hypothetical protein
VPQQVKSSDNQRCLLVQSAPPPQKKRRPLVGPALFRLLAICLARTGANWHKVLLLFFSEQPRFRYEAHAERYLERETRAATGCDIDRQMRVLPMFELALG